MTTLVLLKKELVEHWRTHKLLIVSVVLLVFGMASPLVLAYLPQIMEVAGEGIVVQLPDFTPTDAVKSYLDSLGQMGLLATILISMGAIALERERGTAVLVLSKPVGTGPFVLAKLLGLAAVLVVGMAVGALGNYGYTAVLPGFPDVMAFAAANLLAGLYLLSVISMTLLFSAAIKNQIGAGVVTLGVVVAGGLLSIVPALEPYLPSSLMHWAYSVNAGAGDSRWAALAVAWAIVVTCTVAAGQVLHRQEL
mgnify:CR=1 FL=1